MEKAKVFEHPIRPIRPLALHFSDFCENVSRQRAPPSFVERAHVDVLLSGERF
jgi:hypothetical protein